MLDADITIDEVGKLMGHASITVRSTATATCCPADGVQQLDVAVAEQRPTVMEAERARRP
jgi:hypothetical protein